MQVASWPAARLSADGRLPVAEKDQRATLSAGSPVTQIACAIRRRYRLGVRPEAVREQVEQITGQESRSA
jgi:hypothetical protein